MDSTLAEWGEALELDGGIGGVAVQCRCDSTFLPIRRRFDDHANAILIVVIVLFKRARQSYICMYIYIGYMVNDGK